MEQQEMNKILEKAEVLIEALPYIQKFNRKIIVVKYGGSAMSNEELLKLVGFKPIIVHGGGKEISRWVGKVGKEARFVNGLRVTDEETMEIAEMVLNKVNKNLVRMVGELGVRAVGVSGKDGGLLQCDKKYADGEDIGYVGEITHVDPKVLYDLLEKDFLPIVAPIGLDNQFQTYNINADDAACAIAKAVGADKLVFLTDIEGLYKDIHDKASFISRLTASQAEELIDGGFIGGGMLPKLNNCTSAVHGGVSRVHILDGRIPHCPSCITAQRLSGRALAGFIFWMDGLPTACFWKSSQTRVSELPLSEMKMGLRKQKTDRGCRTQSGAGTQQNRE